jgi:hypothetical protein
MAKFVRQRKPGTWRIGMGATRQITIHSESTVLVFNEAVEGVLIVPEDATDANVIEDRPWVDPLIWKMVVRNRRCQTGNFL